MSKCDFCDITLRTDLEVSKHLASGFHQKNVENFISIQPQDRVVQRNTPSNLVEVFQVLKLRSISDLNDLKDRNYFHIPKGNRNLLGVSDEIATVLIKCTAEFVTKDLPSQTRETLLNVVNNVRIEDPVRPSPPKQVTRENQTTQGSAQSLSKGQPQPGPSVRKTATRHPDIQPPPRRAPPPNPLPPLPTLPSLRKTNNNTQPKRTVTAPQKTPQGSQIRKEPQATWQGSRLPNQPVGPRVPTHHPRARQPNPQVQSSSSGPRPTNQPRPGPITGTRHPAPQRAADSRKLPPQPGTSTGVVRPRTSDSNESQAKKVRLDPQSSRPQTGPQPRLDSTYKPKLAKIKIEPKD